MKKLFLTLAVVSATLSAGAADWKYIVDPAEGEVDKLNVVTITFPNVDEIEVNSSDDITVTRGDIVVEGVKASVENDNELCVVFATEQKAPGTYKLNISAGALAGYADNYAWMEDNGEDIEITWTIASGSQSELDFAYKSSLPNDEYLAYFGELTLEFTAVDKVSYSGSGIAVKKNGEELADVDVKTDANKLTLTLKEALNFVEATIVVVIAPESLTAVKGDVTASNLDQIKLTYKMATPIEYDLTLAINNPKPNSDGQISADRSLESMFFVCEEKDLVAAEGSQPNITLKSEEGDFEATAHLRKGNGLNKNFSYFTASFGKEPTYNGTYIITVKRGAFGSAAWAEDPNYGHSNDEIELRFELIDGVDREAFNITPVSILPQEGTYSKGSEIASVTLTFEKGIAPVKGASAMLAGIDVNYRQESTFVSASNGGYTVTFSPAPSEYGKYLLTVAEGTFGDADFIANGEGKGSAPISINYMLSRENGLEEIGAISFDATHSIYNIQGIRIESSIDQLPSGLYIIDGKKVMIK